ncbi:MFS general substrate transporter [Metschnikowia bicuspidata var. bicuspidata NRRL YB-4993]|uniref:MFS general substrate transporter n=1 Tax=Metschnikowia bicuspidata var. bicuspidata NRRL YB-4993 TaxID=869754 RepID=A0A1A0HCR3_9ASCO|nr:MFS general substrate transporter [Metschnikowia bicuspidata var. bicuspidata NRRL YB-4993]OBA21775.1 MFS general substrate transporter [Metschnikowia bicuspidata var. bicuspidata NRRL YB-4993]
MRGSGQLPKKSDLFDVAECSISESDNELLKLLTNPFSDPVVAEHYKSIYEKREYECRSAFDPDFEWTQKEEKTVIRKLNWRVTFTSCVLFFALQIDRGNLAQAVADNLLDDLGLTTDDYNLGNNLFLASFLPAEIPSQLISKAIGPDRFIPIQILCWSIVAISQAAMKNKTGFYITRVLIGALEGGFIADLVLWISYFYKSKELPICLSFFWTAYSATQICTSLLAFGLLRMRGIRDMAGWRWLFIVEGVATFFIGLWGFHSMVPSAVETKSTFNPNGWFTEREEKIVVNRVLRDDPSKGDMNNRQALSVKMIWSAFSDYDLWPIYIIGFLVYIPMATVQPYMTLTLLLGFSTFDVNLLNIPQNMIHILLLIGITWFSELVNERTLTCLSLPIFTLPFMAALRWWPGSMHQAWPTWALVSMVLAAPYVHAICVGWVSRNSNSIRSRSICSALYNVFVQLGNIVANNIYREDDKPLYHRGNKNLFILTAICIPCLLLTKGYYIWRNRSRDKIWNSLSLQEQENYVKYSEDQGNKRLDFRFDH